MSRQSVRIAPLQMLHTLRSPGISDSESDSSSSPESPLSPSGVDTGVESRRRDGERRDREFLQSLKGLLKVYRYGRAERDSVLAASAKALSKIVPHNVPGTVSSASQLPDGKLAAIAPHTTCSWGQAPPEVMFSVVCERHGDEMSHTPDAHPVFLTLETAQAYVGSLYFEKQWKMRSKHVLFGPLLARVGGESYLDLCEEYDPQSSLDIQNRRFKRHEDHINLFILTVPLRA